MFTNKSLGQAIQFERIVDYFIVNITRTELIIEYYESVVTCREVLEFREIFYFGEYHCFLFETI